MGPHALAVAADVSELEVSTVEARSWRAGPLDEQNSPGTANVPFEVVDERHHRRRSIVFTNNKPPERWGHVLHDPNLAETILDRILERDRIITLEASSMRTRQFGPVPCRPDQETTS